MIRGKQPARGRVLLRAAAQRIPAPEEEGTPRNAADQPGKAEQRVAVAACKAENRTPRTAEKDQRAHGRNHAENEAHQRRGTAAGAEFACGQSHAQGTEHEPMISGRIYCTMAARCRPSPPAMSRSKQATQMPMLAGLPNFCSRNGRSSDDGADNNDAGRAGKGVLAVHEKAPP